MMCTVYSYSTKIKVLIRNGKRRSAQPIRTTRKLIGRQPACRER